jgi:alpha-N-arabinofuranosidase
MTTFTRVDSNGQAEIAVYPSRKLSKINDNIYGGFTEHSKQTDGARVGQCQRRMLTHCRLQLVGRCIYGGLYDPDNPKSDLIDENGFRRDVIDALESLKIPVVRYPGGNFVATYHWLDGVGPREKRPPRPELAWLGVESNQFGTDEFMKWCEVVGTEPYLCLNFGTGSSHRGLQ